MYRKPTQPLPEGGDEAALNERLKNDASGELRDRMIGELRIAARDIEAALAARPVAAVSQVLRNLLEAVRLGERTLVEVWNSLQG